MRNIARVPDTESDSSYDEFDSEESSSEEEEEEEEEVDSSRNKAVDVKVLAKEKLDLTLNLKKPTSESQNNIGSSSKETSEDDSSAKDEESSEEEEEEEKPPHAVSMRKENRDLNLKKPASESQNNKARSSSQSESRSQGDAVNKPLDLSPKKSASENQINVNSSSEETSEEDSSAKEEEGDISSRNKAVAVEKPPHAVDMQRENLDLNLKNKAGSGSQPESRSQADDVNKPNAVNTNSLEEENIDLNPKKSVSESQNKAGSSSQVAAVNQPETEITDPKLDLPAKRAVEDMGQQDYPERKRFKNMVSGRDVVCLMGTETGAYCYGLDEGTVSEVWATEVDKEENRELVERIKNLKDAHWTLQLQEAQLRADVTKMIMDVLRKNQ